jgi:hypothetical protein
LRKCCRSSRARRVEWRSPGHSTSLLFDRPRQKSGPPRHCQHRDLRPRFTIVRFPPGVCSTDICASLMAARTLALPMLARAAICATGKEHLPDVWASFRMTASTAIASVFRHSATSGGAITVAARNLRPHTRRMVGRCLPPALPVLDVVRGGALAQCISI